MKNISIYVINLLIKKYGKPEQINIEVGREFGLGTKGLNELSLKQNKEKNIIFIEQSQ